MSPKRAAGAITAREPAAHSQENPRHVENVIAISVTGRRGPEGGSTGAPADGGCVVVQRGRRMETIQAHRYGDIWALHVRTEEKGRGDRSIRSKTG